MSVIPKILIFDDQEKWASLIAKTIRKVCSPSTTTNPENWNKQIGSTYWDAVIVDVQILGSAKDGMELAEQAILEYGVVSPVIIISGIVNLGLAKEKYGLIFFDYISKINFNAKLRESICLAVQSNRSGLHVHGMLTKLAKKHKIYDKQISAEDLKQFGKLPIHMENFDGNTIGELIDFASGGGNKQMAQKAGKIVLSIMYDNLQ